MHRLSLVALLLAVACGPRANGPNGGGDAELRELLPSVQATAQEGRVEFVLQVTNTTEDPIELVFPTGQSFDFVVRDAAGREVWRWSEGRMFTQAIRHEAVPPGETLTYTAEWEPPAGFTGDFTVEGELTARDRRVTQRASFELQ